MINFPHLKNKKNIKQIYNADSKFRVNPSLLICKSLSLKIVDIYFPSPVFHLILRSTKQTGFVENQFLFFIWKVSQERE